MQIHIAASAGARLRGLIGQEQKLLSHDVLLLAPCRSIHTFLMKQPIDIAFIDRNGVVKKTSERLGPRHFASCRGAAAVLERFSPCDEDGMTEEAVLHVCGQRHDRWFHVGQRLYLTGLTNAFELLPEIPDDADGQEVWANDVLESATTLAFGTFEKERRVEV